MMGSITDELREFVEGHLYLGATAIGGWKEAALAIADRIDTEHQKAIRELNNLADASVLLPVDADGEVIHIGDKMEGVDKYDSLKKVTGEVIAVNFESDGIVDVAIQVWSSDGKSWHRAYLDSGASVYRHYHEPTVEDVLFEFARFWSDEELTDIEHLQPHAAQTIAEFAKKLRLAGDAS